MDGPGRVVALVRCGACSYWARFNARVGVCRRRAPRPQVGREVETVAHWPETFAEEGCGEGLPRGADPVWQACQACAFWMQGNAQGGLNPVDFGDQTRAWWQHAGRCARHAPAPTAHPGLRLVWPATHTTDACGEGTPRGAAEPARLQEEIRGP